MSEKEIDGNKIKEELLSKYYEIDDEIEQLIKKRNELKQKLELFNVKFGTCHKCFREFKDNGYRYGTCIVCEYNL